MKRIYLVAIISALLIGLNSNAVFAQSTLEESLLINQSDEGKIAFIFTKLITKIAAQSERRQPALTQLPECSETILECSEVDGSDRNIAENISIPLLHKENSSQNECTQE